MSKKHALTILDTLITRTDIRQNRSLYYLTSTLKGVYASQREKLENDWCKEWAFKPPFAMANCLDIQPTVNIKSAAIGTMTLNTMAIGSSEKPRKTYTQGDKFNFGRGCVLYDTELAYTLPWGEAKQHIKRFIQVKESTDKSEALPDGLIRFDLYKVECGELALDKSLKMNLNEFVRFLIVGEDEEVKHNDSGIEEVVQSEVKEKIPKDFKGVKAGTFFWRDKYGDLYSMSQMKYDHLKNTCRMLENLDGFSKMQFKNGKQVTEYNKIEISTINKINEFKKAIKLLEKIYKKKFKSLPPSDATLKGVGKDIADLQKL